MHRLQIIPYDDSGGTTAPIFLLMADLVKGECNSAADGHDPEVADSLDLDADHVGDILISMPMLMANWQ